MITWTAKQIARFWSKVQEGPENQCWLWTGYCNYKGYGQVRVDKVLHMAHRVSYMLKVGSIPYGQFVCHHCDNPSCVNPKHLFVGSALDNTMDMIQKNRHFIPKYTEVGSSHVNAKLTEKMVSDIRAAYPTKSMQALADQHGISLTNVHKIIHKKTWQHV